MNDSLQKIPARIFDLAMTSLRSANGSLAGYSIHNPGGVILGVLQAAHAGELLLKFLISKEHPLLIFKNLHEISAASAEDFDIDLLLLKGKTHDFERLPNVYFAATGKKIPDTSSLDEIRKLRNQIQHFMEPSGSDFRSIISNFIYNNIDPILYSLNRSCAIDYVDDEFYDYLVKYLIETETKFSMPKQFSISEFDLELELQGATTGYQKWFNEQMIPSGK